MEVTRTEDTGSSGRDTITITGLLVLIVRAALHRDTHIMIQGRFIRNMKKNISFSSISGTVTTLMVRTRQSQEIQVVEETPGMNP